MAIVCLVFTSIMMLLQCIVVGVAGVKKSHQKVLFLIASVACIVWSLGLLVFYSVSDKFILDYAVKAYYIAAAGIAWVWIPLAVSFATKKTKTAVLAAGFSIVPYIALSVAIITIPSLFIQSITTNPNSVLLEPTGYNIYITYYVVYFLVAVAIMILAHKLCVKKIDRKAVLSVLVAYVIASAIGGYFNLVLPYLGDYSSIWIGPLCLVVFMPITGFAIARYRLFNVKLVAGRVISFVICLAVVLLGYVFIKERLLDANIEDSTFVDAIVVAFSVVGFYVIMRFITLSTNGLFNNALLDNRLFDNISRLAIDNVDIQKMLDHMTRTIVKSSKSSYSLLSINVANKNFISRTQGHKIDQPDLDVIYQELKKRKTGVLITEEIDNNENIYNVLTANNISIVSILRDNDTHQIIGMLVIGQEKPTLYSDKEITALSAICDVIVIAVRNSELSMLDKTKDEFMSIASHQLRTPLTSIQGYTSMILDGDFGKANQEQTHALNEVITSARRMAVLIDDLLNISRLQSGRFLISRVATNMAQLARDEIDQAKLMASAHGITLVYDDKDWDKIPEISVDQAKVGEVMANLIDNAIFYSRHDSKVEIYLTQNAGDVEFRVKDHGIGVPKKDQADLFTKFFRASNARTIRPDGTGIGLFLAQKVIREHNGDIIFSSVEGKGSTFGFRLPLK